MADNDTHQKDVPQAMRRGTDNDQFDKVHVIFNGAMIEDTCIEYDFDGQWVKMPDDNGGETFTRGRLIVVWK